MDADTKLNRPALHAWLWREIGIAATDLRAVDARPERTAVVDFEEAGRCSHGSNAPQHEVAAGSLCCAPLQIKASSIVVALKRADANFPKTTGERLHRSGKPRLGREPDIEVVPS